MKNKKITFSKSFEKALSKLPKEIRETTYEKIAMLLDNPSHSSLRVKKMKGTDFIWEMSITMNYRITFEVRELELLLRKIGTHDILNNP